MQRKHLSQPDGRVRPEFYGSGLNDRTLGIVGMGAVGRTIARGLAGFDLDILYYDPRRLKPAEESASGLSYLPLRNVLGLSDFIILCVPLKADTFHLVNEQNIATMKKGSYLVNICRGSVVDEQAVAKVLKSGQLAGYAADVFEMEDRHRENRPIHAARRRA